MRFPLYLLYPLYTGAIVLVMIAVVPRERIRRLAVFGVIYGGLGDALVLLILFILNIAGYRNYGPFAFLGLPFFPPLAWSAYFIIFLHLLPERYPWNYVFTLAAAGYSIVFSKVLQNLGLFQWKSSSILPPLIVYFIWMMVAVFTYQRFFRETTIDS